MISYHRVYANININNIIDNYKSIKEHVGDSEVMIVIKADGYGHGAIPIAKALNKVGVDRVGVATIHEAIAIRKMNENIPILILGYTHEDQNESLINYDITQTVYSLKMAKKISQLAVKLSKIAKIHIKVDTGMGRIGFFPSLESVESVLAISQLPNLYIEGILTHFSKADESDKTYTNLQIEKFDDFVGLLEEKGLDIPYKHASNSAGLIEFKEANYNIVRAGIVLYGLYPSTEVSKSILKLKPALSLLSHVIFIKNVEKGTKISYGGIYTTKERSVIATIPVGYGDGYPRALSSKGRVLIRGQYAKIVGRVCMDQFMVDVTHIEGVCEGDEVVLIGEQGGNSIPVEEIANLSSTINYEIVCQLGKRIPRIYWEDNEQTHSIDYF